MWYGEVTVPTYLLIGCRREDASPRKRFKFCRGIYILEDQTVGCLWGKAIGPQGIAIDWVGGRYGRSMIFGGLDWRFADSALDGDVSHEGALWSL